MTNREKDPLANIFQTAMSELIKTKSKTAAVQSARVSRVIEIAADKEIIPELLQSKCNSKNIFLSVDKIFNDKKSIDDQIIFR